MEDVNFISIVIAIIQYYSALPFTNLNTLCFYSFSFYTFQNLYSYGKISYKASSHIEVYVYRLVLKF